MTLGIPVQDNLKWNHFLAEGPANFAKRLQQKLSAIKIIRKYQDEKTTRILYGASLWVGAPNYKIKKNKKNHPFRSMQNSTRGQIMEVVYKQTVDSNEMAPNTENTGKGDCNSDPQNNQ